MASLGDWTYDKNFTYELFDDQSTIKGTGTLYTEGAKVGDAAQTYFI